MKKIFFLALVLLAGWQCIKSGETITSKSPSNIEGSEILGRSDQQTDPCFSQGRACGENPCSEFDCIIVIRGFTPPNPESAAGNYFLCGKGVCTKLDCPPCDACGSGSTGDAFDGCNCFCFNFGETETSICLILTNIELLKTIEVTVTSNGSVSNTSPIALLPGESMSITLYRNCNVSVTKITSG